MQKSVFLFYFRDSCHFEKINEKNPEKNKNIYRWLYYIPNIKLKIMLYEPFVKYGLKIYWEVWKSMEF